MYMIEWFRSFAETIKMNMKNRLVGLIFCLLVLAIKPFSKVLGMEWFYNKFTILLVLGALLFASTLIVDLASHLKSDYDLRKSRRDFDSYILNLSGRKLAIVKAIYEGEGRAARFRIGDTDVRELVARKVIYQATTNYAVFPNEENLSNPPMYFLLQPRTLELIERDPTFFIKREK